ncbi:MAG: hypothetical protein IJ874_03350 [Ruminococcus sp.]|nr:hypothetical protein [Ruminococcus sp.]
MRLNILSTNSFYLRGRIVALNIYAGGKAMNVKVGVENSNDSSVIVNMKYFNSELFGLLKKGMPVIVHGHIGGNSYVDKDGVRRYRDSNDLIADCFEIIESKTETKKRELEELYDSE